MSTTPTSRAPRSVRAALVVVSIASFVVAPGAIGRSSSSQDAVEAAGGPTWKLSVIAKGDDFSSLALDSAGNAHVTYMTRSKLVHATNATGVWVAQTVANSGAYVSSVAVDHADNVHIAFGGGGKLSYATNASGTWVVTTVFDPGYDVGDDASIGLDSLDKVHIACLDRENGHLLYATNASGDWVVTDLGSGGYGAQLTIDSNGFVHIVHDRFSSGSEVAYTTNATGGWNTTAIGSTAGYRNGIAVDGLGMVHVSYFDASYTVYYATNATGSWVSTVVDGDVGDASHSSIVLDSAANAHITYGDYGHYDLKYATNASGSWVVAVIDAAGNKGYSSSLAIDENDLLSVSYTDRSSHKVRFATTRNLATLTSVAGQDGWVLESAEHSGVGASRNIGAKATLLGDDQLNRQYRTILSFSTAGLPDEAVIVSARLKLTKSTVTGTDPFTTHGALRVDIGTPWFGTTPALKADDFAAAAGFVGAGTVGGTEEDGFYVSELDDAALGSISRTAITQLRLRFETSSDSDGQADTVAFFSGNAPKVQRPVLIVSYYIP